jgi:hypothetical protein
VRGRWTVKVQLERIEGKTIRSSSAADQHQQSFLYRFDLPTFDFIRFVGGGADVDGHLGYAQGYKILKLE